jgi:UDP-glucose 4-epimerase
VATLLLDPSLTEAEFGWKTMTTLRDGIAAAVEWYQRHGVTETFTHLKMQG